MTDELTPRLQEAVQNGWFQGDGPEPRELAHYLDILTNALPDDAEPHLFRCGKESKAPAIKFGSWKADKNKLTPEEAVEAMERGYNIGIAGMEGDCLANIDYDDPEVASPEDTPETLKLRSRSRAGRHEQVIGTDPGEIPNITTGDIGEVRAQGEYVVAPGSYVEPPEDGVPEGQEPVAGYYTVEEANPLAEIEYGDLPDAFIEAHQYQTEAAQEENQESADVEDFDPPDSEETSAVFDLQVRDIVPLEGGETSPSKRWSALFHGSTTDANMSVSNKGRLQCWRHKVAHGGLQVLAVLSGETGCLEAGSGHKNGSAGPCRLDTGELVWAAWKYAKNNGYIPATDPIPHSALVYVATNAGIADHSDIEDGWKLPAEQYNDALEHITDEYGLDHGRRYVTSAGTSAEGGRPDTTAAFLPDRDDVVDIHDQETPISLSEVHSRVYNEIDASITRQRNTLIDAIMGSGKTYSTFKVAADRNIPITYFAPRHDLYDQAEEYAIECGIPEDEILILPSMPRDCPTWNGEYGQEWANRVKHQYHHGVQPGDIHSLNDDIPCQEHGESGDCPYGLLWDFDPEDYQVIIGHYNHAHIPTMTAGRVAVFDEEPASAFQSGLYGDELIESVNTFLSFAESPPVDDFDDLIQSRRDRDKMQRVVAWFEHPERSLTPDSQNVVRLSDDEQTYHALAPHAVYTIALGEPIDDGANFEYAPLPDTHHDGLFFSTSEEHPEYYVEIQQSPNTSYASCVLALDGTPLTDATQNDGNEAREWVNALGTQLHHSRILSDEERSQFLSETMNHTYIQTSEYRKPYSSGRYNNPHEDAALLAGVTQEYGNGSPPVVFTSQKVKNEYEDRGFEDAGIAKTFDYPQNIRGTDRYGDERLCVQLGSSHHGDHKIRRRAAWLHETIDVEGKGNDRDYGSEVGNKIYEQITDQTTLQNVMRVGRDGDGATIVLHTSAFPDWLPIDGTGSVSAWGGGKRNVREVVSQLAERGEADQMEVSDIVTHDSIDVTKRHVLNCLDEFANMGLLSKRTHPEDGRRVVFADTGLSDIEETEQAEWELDDVDLEIVDGEGEVVREDEICSTKLFLTRQFATTAAESGNTSNQGSVIDGKSKQAGKTLSKPPD